MWYFRSLRFFSKLGRQYIRNFKQQGKVDFNLKLLSGAIDQGLFGKPVYNPLHCFDFPYAIENQ